MATGRLGIQDMSGATNYSVYTVPSGYFAVCSVSLCNRGATSASVRISVSSAATPAAGEYLEFDSELVANGVLERTGIVMDAGKILVVRSTTASVSAVVMGIETSTT